MHRFSHVKRNGDLIIIHGMLKGGTTATSKAPNPCPCCCRTFLAVRVAQQSNADSNN